MKRNLLHGLKKMIYNRGKKSPYEKRTIISAKVILQMDSQMVYMIITVVVIVQKKYRKN